MEFDLNTSAEGVLKLILEKLFPQRKKTKNTVSVCHREAKPFSSPSNETVTFNKEFKLKNCFDFSRKIEFKCSKLTLNCTGLKRKQFPLSRVKKIDKILNTSNSEKIENTVTISRR